MFDKSEIGSAVPTAPRLSSTRPGLIRHEQRDDNARHAGPVCEAVDSDGPTSPGSFANQLRTVRVKLACKQLVFSRAIGCTDAALSHWESAARLPTPKSLSRILAAIAKGGGSTADILLLRGLWRDEYWQRRTARTSMGRPGNSSCVRA